MTNVMPSTNGTAMLVPEGTALPGPAARASVAAQPYNLPAEVDLVMKGHEDGG
jgi:hypothetical protein